MPGGPREAYDVLEPMLVAIAAKSAYGPCVSYIGPGGSGHYVKMIHNGIEYGDMQLIAEARCDALRARHAGREIASVFADWNTQARLVSHRGYRRRSSLHRHGNRTPLVDLILDAAEQKGTGRWTIESALDLASPVPTIDAAVTARNLSALRGLRVPGQRGPGRSVSRSGTEQAAACSAVPTALTGPRRARGCPLLLEGLLLRLGNGAAQRGECRLNWLISRRSPASGPEAASSAPRFWRHHAGLPRESGSGQPAARSPDRRPVGRDRWRGPPRHRGGSVVGHPGAGNVVGARLLRHPASRLFPPISSRRNATISAHTPTSAAIARASSTPSGTATSNPRSRSPCKPSPMRQQSRCRWNLFDPENDPRP